MQYFPPALENLVEQFAKLPGVGVKSAQRLAFHVLSMPEDAEALCGQSHRHQLHGGEKELDQCMCRDAARGRKT